MAGSAAERIVRCRDDVLLVLIVVGAVKMRCLSGRSVDLWGPKLCAEERAHRRALLRPARDGVPACWVSRRQHRAGTALKLLSATTNVHHSQGCLFSSQFHLVYTTETLD